MTCLVFPGCPPRLGTSWNLSQLPRLMEITVLKEHWQIWRTSESWLPAGAQTCSRISRQRLWEIVGYCKDAQNIADFELLDLHMNMEVAGAVKILGHYLLATSCNMNFPAQFVSSAHLYTWPGFLWLTMQRSSKIAISVPGIGSSWMMLAGTPQTLRGKWQRMLVSWPRHGHIKLHPVHVAFRWGYWRDDLEMTIENAAVEGAKGKAWLSVLPVCNILSNFKVVFKCAGQASGVSPPNSWRYLAMLYDQSLKLVEQLCSWKILKTFCRCVLSTVYCVYVACMLVFWSQLPIVPFQRWSALPTWTRGAPCWKGGQWTARSGMDWILMEFHRYVCQRPEHSHIFSPCLQKLKNNNS